MDDFTPSETESIIFETARDFFENIGIVPQIAISQDQEYYTLQIDTDNPGLLIGYRGDNLSAIQHLLGLHVKHKTGKWHKLIVNVGDYREQRQQTLEQLAQNAAQRVEFSGEPYLFHNLTPPERRVVHMALQEHPAVTTQSQGEGRSRQLAIIPK